MTYTALLRGVNVGGKNKISMPLLKSAFENSGFGNVETYINSGNIIFESDLDETSIIFECENLIAKDFGLRVSVALINRMELTEALENAPAWWDESPNSKHNAIFLIPPATSHEVLRQVGETKTEYEQVYCHGKLIFWSAPIATFSHTRWSNVVKNKAVYNSITIRNANTTKKLAEIMHKCS